MSHSSNAFGDSEGVEFLAEIEEYCQWYKIPQEALMEILEDQKVLPMIRGKATEFAAVEYVTQMLNRREWTVEKLNLNAQKSQHDEDATITHRRSGRRIRIEAKNASRGSFKLTLRKKILPRFQIKCHKSRSNLKRQDSGNDRYTVDDFDLLICNPSNAIVMGKAQQPGLPLIEDEEAIQWLKSHCGVTSIEKVFEQTYDDWRFCFPESIADEDGLIPRTPTVLMDDDPNWLRGDALTASLILRISSIK